MCVGICHVILFLMLMVSQVGLSLPAWLIIPGGQAVLPSWEVPNGTSFFVYSVVLSVAGLVLVIAFEILKFACCTRAFAKIMLIIFAIAEIALLVYTAFIIKGFVSPLSNFDSLCEQGALITNGNQNCTVEKTYYYIGAICSCLLVLVILSVEIFTVRLVSSYHRYNSERREGQPDCEHNVV
mmetsp:Transcript_12072/g.19222  ORF Transcript_12072/g.19222 Transcript_12072/m.19222 type:complete len:182 (-) Transcript_12072:52-597(-)